MIYIVQTEENRSRHQSKEWLNRCAASYMEGVGISQAVPRLLRTPRGKPYFEGEPFHFSISHSGAYWVCAFGGKPLGLDIQQMEDKEKWLALARRFFHPHEICYLEDKAQRDFYQIWCAKEAWVKYTGQGIGGLQGFTVVDAQGLKAEINGVPLTFPTPPPGYFIALCGIRAYRMERFPQQEGCNA